MPNFRLLIEYRGTNYYGWQVQNKTGLISLQGKIESALSRILQEKVKLIGSGRTDSGVHALALSANFFTKKNFKAEKLKTALNALLPNDIVIKRVDLVSKDFHSRFSAKSKVYRYLILNQSERSSFLKDLAYFYPYPLDIKSMIKASSFLIGKHDFKAFVKAETSKTKSTIRTIKNIVIKKIKETLFNAYLISIEIEADGFLHKMVRNMVGTLIEIGRKKISPQQIKKILASKDRRLAGPCVPAHGLYLVKINY
ncbi:MAG: tRNA pseudouridine(38-40) synthase TruA [Candidatus Omnitrophica bacterium]|nr:tRNA pseudouridine(38-40) synthase TruA [Candidatus Omnitrophota bacterium]